MAWECKDYWRLLAHRPCYYRPLLASSLSTHQHYRRQTCQLLSQATTLDGTAENAGQRKHLSHGHADEALSVSDATVQYRSTLLFPLWILTAVRKGRVSRTITIKRVPPDFASWPSPRCRGGRSSTPAVLPPKSSINSTRPPGSVVIPQPEKRPNDAAGLVPLPFST